MNPTPQDMSILSLVLGASAVLLAERIGPGELSFHTLAGTIRVNTESLIRDSASKCSSNSPTPR